MNTNINVMINDMIELIYHTSFMMFLNCHENCKVSKIDKQLSLFIFENQFNKTIISDILQISSKFC